MGVGLIESGGKMPSWCDAPEKPVRHCQSIMRARRGESMAIPAEKHMCGIGAAALGMAELGDEVRSGEFHTKMGLYGAKEAAGVTMELNPSLPPGSTMGTVVAPLSRYEGEPDVVVVVAQPEQVYWLLPVALTYRAGGRSMMDLASVQAACADATAVPYLCQHCNLSLGCFGCRKSTDMEPQEMLLGIPAALFPEMVEAVEELAEGPIPKSRVKG